MYKRTTKVLPSTYDDSLSYYEQILKLNKRVVDLEAIINGDNTEIIKNLLNECIFRCTYDEPNERLIFGYEVIESGEEIHEYSDTTNTLYIKAKE